LAFIGNDLYANAVGRNTVVKLYKNGQYKDVWWPRCVESQGKPITKKNYIQLNSIAASKSLLDSYFTASTDLLTYLCPGHKNFPVNQRGVIFSGQTRKAVVKGLTRPHSARWHNKQIWLNNSGYGEFGFADFSKKRFVPIVRLRGWTRGLCFYKDIVFVGVSRVIRRFYNYAPGLELKKSISGLYAIDLKSGKVLGSLIWPLGNQIFAVEWIKESVASGFPFDARKKTNSQVRKLFYSFSHGD